MVFAAGEFLLKQADLHWILGSDRMGHAMYRVASKVVSAPFTLGVSEVTKGFFQEPTPIPDEKKLTQFFAKYDIRKISNSGESLVKIFDVAVALAIFIPATLVAKEVAIAMGFAELAMVTTPLLTLLQQEAASLIASKFFDHLIELMVVYIEK